MHIFQVTTDLSWSITGVVEVSVSLGSGYVHPREYRKVVVCTGKV